MARRERSEGSTVDMTPMIDVVFQLIIFFIVTVKLEQDINPDIILEHAPDAPAIERSDPRTTIIEVNRRGWISMHGAQLTKTQLQSILKAKFNRRGGQFPVLIRGDQRTRHKDIRAVMDMCTEIGVWKINFAAIKEKKT